MNTSALPIGINRSRHITCPPWALDGSAFCAATGTVGAGAQLREFGARQRSVSYSDRCPGCGYGLNGARITRRSPAMSPSSDGGRTPSDRIAGNPAVERGARQAKQWAGTTKQAFGSKKQASQRLTINVGAIRGEPQFSEGTTLATHFCRYCSATLRTGDLRCHHCGALLPTSNSRAFLLGPLIAILMALFLIFLFW